MDIAQMDRINGYGRQTASTAPLRHGANPEFTATLRSPQALSLEGWKATHRAVSAVPPYVEGEAGRRSVSVTAETVELSEDAHLLLSQRPSAATKTSPIRFILQIRAISSFIILPSAFKKGTTQ